MSTFKRSYKLNQFKIYLIRNTANDMVYVGYTSGKLNTRLIEHKSHARRRFDNCALHRQIRDLGEDKFHIQLLDTASTKEEAMELEDFFIGYYKQRGKCYNKQGGHNFGKIC